MSQQVDRVFRVALIDWEDRALIPSIYGYARLLPGADAGAELLRLRRKLHGYAGARGLTLRDVLLLKRPGDRLRVWTELVWRCRVEVADIVAPSLAHLHEDEAQARHMAEDVARSIGGRVWIVGLARPFGAPPHGVGVMAG